MTDALDVWYSRLLDEYSYGLVWLLVSMFLMFMIVINFLLIILYDNNK